MTDRISAYARYPWDVWTDGTAHEHIPSMSPEAFRAYLYAVAKRKDVYVSATIDGPAVRFQFFKTLTAYKNRGRWWLFDE